MFIICKLRYILLLLILCAIINNRGIIRIFFINPRINPDFTESLVGIGLSVLVLASSEVPPPRPLQCRLSISQLDPRHFCTHFLNVISLSPYSICNFCYSPYILTIGYVTVFDCYQCTPSSMRKTIRSCYISLSQKAATLCTQLQQRATLSTTRKAIGEAEEMDCMHDDYDDDEVVTISNSKL